MSEAELNQLERDVEQARQRFTTDLARLRSPSIFSDFKDELVAEFRHSKDELVEKTTSAAQDRAHGVLAEIKDRAAANPAAALAIGAGLAWHLARHPPITSVLVGLGLMSLWRTNPQQPAAGADMLKRATELAGTAKDKVEEWRASDTAAQAGELVATAKEKVTGTAEALSERGVRLWNDTVHDGEERDKVLLGAAALALTAAIGIAAQRRMS